MDNFLVWSTSCTVKEVCKSWVFIPKNAVLTVDREGKEDTRHFTKGSGGQESFACRLGTWGKGE